MLQRHVPCCPPLRFPADCSASTIIETACLYCRYASPWNRTNVAFLEEDTDKDVACKSRRVPSLGDCRTTISVGSQFATCRASAVFMPSSCQPSWQKLR